MNSTEKDIFAEQERTIAAQQKQIDELRAALEAWLSPLPDSTINFYGWFAERTNQARSVLAKYPKG